MSREKKLECGFSMPAVGLGTWRMGGRETRDPEDDGTSSVEALIAGIELGYRQIDTAEMYAGGFTEELVGRAIAGFDRASLFLTSKVWKTHLHYDDVLRAAEGSLRRLGTDYLDLYLIHQVNPDVPLRETMRAMNRLVDEKVIRGIGVSNFSVERFRHAQDWADSKLLANQVHYNLKVREAERSGLLKYCQENDVMLIAWRPFQKGGLLEETPECLKEVAAEAGLTPSQTALSWLTSQKNLVTISMSHSREHLEENLRAGEQILSEDAIEFLRREYPGQTDISEAVPLS